MDKELEPMLKYLRLEGLLAHWGEHLAAARNGKFSHERLLKHVLRAEYQAKQEQARMMRRKQARIPEMLEIETFRVQISGDPIAAGRLEFQIAQGFCVAGLSFALLWLVFGRTRWTLKILPLFFIVAFICATITYVFGIGSWAAAETLAGLLAFTTWMTLIGWIANMIGFRLAKSTVDPTDAARTKERRRKHFLLRDIFVITGAVAIFFAVIRFVPLHQIQVWSWAALEVNVYSLLLSIHVLCATWCALSSRALWARLAIWLSVATLMPLAGIAFQANLHRIANYMWIAEFHISVHTAATVAVFSLMHVYRWRGWRFQVGERSPEKGRGEV